MPLGIRLAGQRVEHRWQRVHFASSTAGVLSPQGSSCQVMHCCGQTARQAPHCTQPPSQIFIFFSPFDLLSYSDVFHVGTVRIFYPYQKIFCLCIKRLKRSKSHFFPYRRQTIRGTDPARCPIPQKNRETGRRLIRKISLTTERFSRDGLRSILQKACP